jgi:peptidoglycan/LPS O-acetylase OafA/YrhL
METTIKKFAYVDALRGLAIIGVMLAHIKGGEYLPTFLANIIGHGPLGVQLFFIVSAFALFSSLSFRKEGEKRPFINFFIRRFFRIAPMYYLAIIYYFWQGGQTQTYWLGDASGISAANLAANFLFLHGLYPYWINSVVPGGWTIAVETSFYLLLPFLFLKIKNANQALNFVMLSLIIRIAFLVLLRQFHPIACDRLWVDYLVFFLPNQLPIFSLGILMFFIIKENYKPDFSPLTLLFLAVFLFANLSVSALPYHILFGASFLVLGLALSKRSYKIIVNPFICHVGKISFSLYLIHFAVIYWLEKFGFFQQSFVSGNIKYVLNVVVVFAVSILFSSLSYKFIELTTQNLGKKIIKIMENKNQPISLTKILPKN